MGAAEDQVLTAAGAVDQPVSVPQVDPEDQSPAGLVSMKASIDQARLDSPP